MNFKCPLCRSSLSEAHYHRVIKVQAKQQKTQKGDLERLQKLAEKARADATSARRREQQTRAKSKQQIDAAKKEAARSEQSKSAIRVNRLMARIGKLEEEKRMLKKHTSPQSIGLADEEVLVRKLRIEFPDDRIIHAGKGGDVLQYVAFKSGEAGCIVYECKHTDRIESSHVRQTALAKKSRQADFGILVTTGTRKGFAGLDQEAGIFLVAQSAVLTLAHICRESLVTMAQQRLDAAAKARAARKLMDYVTSPVFKTPLEEAISQAEKAQRNLEVEVRQHVALWKERHFLYETIRYDVSHVQNNIHRVLSGSEPLKLEKPIFGRLAIPMT